MPKDKLIEVVEQAVDDYTLTSMSWNDQRVIDPYKYKLSRMVAEAIRKEMCVREHTFDGHTFCLNCGKEKQ